VILLDKPKKQSGFWSFTAIYVSLYLLAYIPIGVINLYFIRQFVGHPSILATAIHLVMLIPGVIVAIFLAVHIYAKRRRITPQFARKMSLIYLIIGGFLFLYNTARALFWPQLIHSGSDMTVTFVVFFVMRKLLLRKARQQEMLEVSEIPTEPDGKQD